MNHFQDMKPTQNKIPGTIDWRRSFIEERSEDVRIAIERAKIESKQKQLGDNSHKKKTTNTKTPHRKNQSPQQHNSRNKQKKKKSNKINQHPRSNSWERPKLMAKSRKER